MTTNSLNGLEKLAKARKKEALKKDLFNKVKTIANELGISPPDNRRYTYHNRELTTDNLKIGYLIDEWGGDSEISYVYCGGEHVFGSYRDCKPFAKVKISKYNPTVGNWVEEITSLHQQVKNLQEKRAKEEAEADKEWKIKDLKGKFGL